MSLSECRHRGVADSLGDDEIDFGIGELLNAACQLCHGRIEICLKPVAAAPVESVTGRLLAPQSIRGSTTIQTIAPSPAAAINAAKIPAMKFRIGRPSTRGERRR